MKWNHAVYSGISDHLAGCESSVGLWLTYSIRSGTTAYLHQNSQTATGFQLGVQVSQENDVWVLPLSANVQGW